MSSFVSISYIQVNNMNAQPAQFFVGFPAMTAFLGFAHSLALKLGAKAHDGVAVILHEFDFCGEFVRLKAGSKLFFNQMKAAGFIDMEDYAQGSFSLSSQPLARARGVISLVVALPDDAEFIADDVKKVLRGGRLAGGDIIKVRDVKVYQDFEALSRALPSGFSVVERQDLMRLKADEKDMIDALLRATKMKAARSDEEGDDEDNEDDSWISPACLGYAGVSARAQRHGSRLGLPHVYVEPLIGLIQFRSVRTSGLHFWRYVNPEVDVFVATTA